MVKNHRFAKSINESSRCNFIQLLQYNAESAGCVAVVVKPQHIPMSCTECKNVQEISIAQRTFLCKKCSVSKDRGINVLINIFNRATLGQRGSHACGEDVSTFIREAVVDEAGTIRAAS